MSIFEKLGRWLDQEDPPARADALMVLDGGDFPGRFAAGLDLLRRGYGTWLLVSQSFYHQALHQAAEEEAKAHPENIILLRNRAVSTRQEAQAVRPVLSLLGCRNVLLVTSWYHTRRAGKIFARELKPESIDVRTYSVPIPDKNSWWKSQADRRVVLFEAVKWLATLLRPKPAFPGGWRFRLKAWAEGGSPSIGRVAAGATSGSRPSEVSGGHPAKALTMRAPGPPLATAPDFLAAWTGGAQTPREEGRRELVSRIYRAANIVVKESDGHTALVEAFNTWAEKEKPLVLVHVHYFDNSASKTYGYQVIYEKISALAQQPLREVEEIEAPAARKTA